MTRNDKDGFLIIQRMQKWSTARPTSPMIGPWRLSRMRPPYRPGPWPGESSQNLHVFKHFQTIGMLQGLELTAKCWMYAECIIMYSTGTKEIKEDLKCGPELVEKHSRKQHRDLDLLKDGSRFSPLPRCRWPSYSGGNSTCTRMYVCM